MNKITRYMMLAASAAGALFTVACSETDADKDKGATPHVEYARVCRPEAADSLITEASMGSKIAFIGTGLGDVQQVWFNDRKAKLNPTQVNTNVVIVDVPNQLPDDVTDMVTFITSKGNKCEYPFHVVVPAPVITRLSCQYARPGETLVMDGDFFIGAADELTVTFPGKIATNPDKAEKEQITVTVPAGATEEGFITVTSIYGTSKVPFKFLEKDGMLCDFEDGSYANPWGLGALDTENGIDGQYLKLAWASNGEWNWQNALCWGYWNTGGRPIATGSLSELAVRFEANIVSWANIPMCLYFNNEDGINLDGPEAQAHWMPWLTLGGDTPMSTNGWTTVTIPLTDFKYDKVGSDDTRTIGDIANYTNFSFMVFGAFTPGTMAFDFDVRIDNLRIVKI